MVHDHNINSVFPDLLKNLLEHFDGAHIVTPAAAGLVLSIKPNTTYSLISRGTFPLPPVVVARRKMVRIVDLANFIIKIGGATPPSSVPVSVCVPDKRGRPHKGTGKKDIAAARSVI